MRHHGIASRRERAVRRHRHLPRRRDRQRLGAGGYRAGRARGERGQQRVGPRTIIVAAGQADLVVVAIGNLPASAAPGASFSATDTVRNQGAGGAVQSKTRYYLSIDGAKTPPTCC